MSELKIVSEAGFLLPLQFISKETIEKAQKKFHHRFYQETKCAKCPYLEDRHGENCDNCSAFLGARITAKKVVYKNKEYLSIPRGHRATAIRLAERDPLVSSVRVVTGHKTSERMKRKISLLETTVLKPYQREAVDTMFAKRRGIIKSPPRSGKTLMAVAFMCEEGGKAIVLAHQREWLLQFKETFYGSKTQQGFTDARPGQVDLARTLADFERLDVCLCTFSQFMSDKGKALLAKIRDKFSVLFVDECFPEDYFVETPGGRVSLKDVQEGDKVLSYNHQSSESEWQEVTFKKISQRSDMMEICIDGQTFRCTPEHPWYCSNKGEYVKAKDLKPGDVVVLKS